MRARRESPSPRKDDGERQLVVLGIEAGATRTVAIAVHADGSRPVRIEMGPANLQMLDDRQLTRHLRAIARALPRPAAVAIGMAGARTATDRARLHRAATHVWGSIPCCATSDLETALMAAGPSPPARRGGDHGGAVRAVRGASALPAARPRVLIISGTGSCCLGRAIDGRTVRVGGWGHIVGDRASGYDIVIATLRAVVQASDRHGRWPALGRRLLSVLRLREPHDLVTWVQGATKTDVAALAPEVFRAAAGGDRLATRVLQGAAATLADAAITCARRVARRGTPVEFVLAGSVLLKQPRFAARVGRRLRQLWPGARVRCLEREGVWGAVALANASLEASARTLEP